MAEFPAYEQIAKEIAEKVLDEFLYDGKSIREWMKILGKEEPRLIEKSDGIIEQIKQEPSEEYKRGWHDAIITALKETHNYYTDDGVFRAIQEESLVGIGMSMQEPKTDVSDTNVGKWISVGERLPERSVWVLAYCKTKDGYEYQTVLLLAKYNGEWTDCDDFCDEVIAWRPLPEPYIEADKEEDDGN